MEINNNLKNNYLKNDYIKNSQTSYVRTETVEKTFQKTIEVAAKKKNYQSAVEDFKLRHPDAAVHVDYQVNLGKAVLRKNGVQNVDRDKMSMEEYKQFFTRLMNSIPYDWSQKRDVNVWSITEDGWEQMKNDPAYEAWVLGYTSEDRSVNNPWTSMPGYSPCYHTEKFGASIDEHLGQGFPMNNSADKTLEKDEESWWVKRHKRMKELLKEQEKQIQSKKAANRKQAMQEREQQAIESRQRMTEYFNSRAMSFGQLYGAELSTQVVASAMTAYDKSIMNMSESGI